MIWPFSSSMRQKPPYHQFFMSFLRNRLAFEGADFSDDQKKVMHGPSQISPSEVSRVLKRDQPSFFGSISAGFVSRAEMGTIVFFMWLFFWIWLI